MPNTHYIAFTATLYHIEINIITWMMQEILWSCIT